MTSDREPLFSGTSLPERAVIAEILRRETVGGILLLVAAGLALVLANSPWAQDYFGLRDLVVGPESLHLNLPVGVWAADGLLAIFFFVAGLEVKREFAVGDLRDPRKALLPVAAAIGGMILPAVVFLLVVSGGDSSARAGWAIPVATDIAFAMAVLAVVGSNLPASLRTFLLTLAVVDDLLAIVIIAVFFADHVNVLVLVSAAVPLLAFGWLVRRQRVLWWLGIPLAVVTWALVHASGVHATVAGVLLAFMIPVRDTGTLESAMRPLSAGFAAPVFAFFAAGVAIGGLEGFGETLRDHVATGVILGLMLGKSLGVFCAAWLVARWTQAELAPDLNWLDVAGVAMLAGVGFTVSLLIAELAFEPGLRADHAKVAVLAGSVLAAALAAVLLRFRDRAHGAAQNGEPSVG